MAFQKIHKLLTRLNSKFDLLGTHKIASYLSNEAFIIQYRGKNYSLDLFFDNKINKWKFAIDKNNKFLARGEIGSENLVSIELILIYVVSRDSHGKENNDENKI